MKTFFITLLGALTIVSCNHPSPPAQEAQSDSPPVAQAQCDHLKHQGDTAMELLLSRRSIRKFTNQPVPDGLIAQILEAAMEAPSAGNQQPWQFVVIKDRQVLDDIVKVHPHARMLLEADAAILVVADAQREKMKGYFPLDCSAATQNALLAAHYLGLGAVWLGVYPDETRVKAIASMLAIPQGYLPFSLIAIGWPGEEKGRGDRFDTARIHRGLWGRAWNEEDQATILEQAQ